MEGVKLGTSICISIAIWSFPSLWPWRKISKLVKAHDHSVNIAC